MRKIWLICPYASPTKYGWPSRPFIIGKELVNRGYRVSIFSFTGSHYLRTGGYQHIQENSWEIHEGVWFLWLRGIKKNRTNILVRVLNWFYFNFQFLHYLKNTEASPDAIILSSPPITLAYLIAPLKNKFPAKIVFEVRDLWPMSLVDLGNYSPRNPVLQWLRNLEKKAYLKSDQIIGVIPGLQRYLEKDIKLKELASKAKHIPQGYFDEEIPSLTGADTQYDIGFAGTLNKANELYTFIAALKILASQNINPNVLIIGVGVNQDKVKQEVVSLPNIEFNNEWYSREKAMELLLRCRVCYSGLKDLKIYNYGISCLKWMDYWMLKKPILTSFSGESYGMDISKFGWQVPAENPELLAEKIRQIMEMKDEDLKHKGEKGFQHLQTHYRMDTIGDAYEKVLAN